MTLFDDAILKAYGQKKNTARRESVGGPHFQTPIRNATDSAPDSQDPDHGGAPRPEDSASSYLETSALEELHDLEEVERSADQPTGEMQCDIAQEPTQDTVAASRISLASDPITRRWRWTDLRHEVTTDSPDLHSWQLPDVVTGDASSGEVEDLDARTLQAPLESANSEPEGTSRHDTDLPDDPATPPFSVPSWEVDRFRLPRVCQQIEQHLADGVHEAAQRILDSYDSRRPVVTVGSWTRGEGRTTVAIVLARALAQTGLRVVLIDADCTNPVLAKHLGIATDVLETIDASESEISERCVRSLSDGFTLLPLTFSADETFPLEQRLDDAIETLRHHYEIILVDQPAGRSDLCAKTVGLHVVVRGDWIDRLEQHGGVPVRLVDNFVHANRISAF